LWTRQLLKKFKTAGVTGRYIYTVPRNILETRKKSKSESGRRVDDDDLKFIVIMIQSRTRRNLLLSSSGGQKLIRDAKMAGNMKTCQPILKAQ
jgi:hypothetical protein